MRHSEEDLWLDCCERNPKQDGETWSDWLTRLSNIMATARREEAVGEER